MRQPPALIATGAAFAIALGATTIAASAAQAVDNGPRSTYIVTLVEGAAPASTRMALDTESAVARARSRGAEIVHEYKGIGGYAANMTARQAAQLKNDPAVLFVRPDYDVSLPAEKTTPLPDNADTSRDLNAPATWGLDRIDQRDMPLSGGFNANATGEGVHMYIIDSGIRKTHSEFTGRIGNGWNFVHGNDNPVDDHNIGTARGHGTMTASIAAGSKWGVAKKATVHALKVLDQSGNGKGAKIEASFDWVTLNAVRPAVVNMSFQGGFDEAENVVIRRMIKAGVVLVAAAGNTGDDACKYSPGSVTELLTVGASDERDMVTPFSAKGKCVDLHAPGAAVGGASDKDDNAGQSAYGTSQAAPYVAGAAALYLQGHPDAEMDEVAKVVNETATKDKIKNPGGSPNRLLFTGDFAASTVPSPRPVHPVPMPTPTAPAPTTPAPTAPPAPTLPGPTQPVPTRP